MLQRPFTRSVNLENFHVALWLLKDCSWCQSWHSLGLAMVAPTLVVSGVITWRSRHSEQDFVHNLAVCLWIMANITWMVGEFFFSDMSRPIAGMFFFTGLILIAGYYLRSLLRSIA